MSAAVALSGAPIAHAQTNGPCDIQNGLSGAVDTVPCLSVPIPGLKFSQITVDKNGDITTLRIPYLAQYINAVYGWAIGAGMVFAATMAIFGGFQYVTAGDSGRGAKALQRVKDSVTGLVITLGAYLILNTINPVLTNLPTLDIETVRGEGFTMEVLEDHADNDATGAGIGQSNGTQVNVSGPGAAHNKAACKTVAECKKLCDMKPRPTSGGTTVPVNQTVVIPTGPGLKGSGLRAKPDLVKALQTAAKEAYDKGYTIVVSSAFRPFATQLALVCNRIGDPVKEAGIGHAVAWPGGSNHGTGSAIDISLIDNATGSRVVSSGNCAAQKAGRNATVEAQQMLNDIMFSAGFRRYSKEIWHYEYGTSSDCRCTSNSTCPINPDCNGGCNQ